CSPISAMPKGELRPSRNALRVSATPSPSASRRSVMRLELFVPAPAFFMNSFWNFALMPLPSSGRSGALVSATSTSPFGSTISQRGWSSPVAKALTFRPWGDCGLPPCGQPTAGATSSVGTVCFCGAARAGSGPTSPASAWVEGLEQPARAIASAESRGRIPPGKQDWGREFLLRLVAMKRLLVGAVLCAAAAAASAQTKSLRWASQGDPQTADPHSQNEGLTNLMAQQVYGTLVMRDKQLGLAPGLAESWSQVNDTTWRFNLRRGVRFSDGTPFTADDVVFSIERAQHPNSQLRQYSNLLGKAVKVDDYTVDLVQKDPNPILIEHATTIFIMSKAWSVKHKVERPLDYKSGEDSYAARNALGAGPWMLVTREPDVKTVLRRNPYWWGKFEGNVTEIVYMPIRSEATRTAALFSGQVDFVLDPPVQDIGRIRANKALKVVE